MSARQKISDGAYATSLGDYTGPDFERSRFLIPFRFHGARMPIAVVNGVRLSYELAGDGSVPLVLVHGSWVSRHSWETVVPSLARDFRVLTYDRRGHSGSERLTTQGSVHEDVADLAALLEHLQMGPAFVVGNSLGGSIALRFAAQHPRHVRGG